MAAKNNKALPAGVTVSNDGKVFLAPGYSQEALAKAGTLLYGKQRVPRKIKKQRKKQFLPPGTVIADLNDLPY